MQLVYFTKFDPALNAAGLAAKARKVGVAGLDLAVREGHAIHPENVGTALPAAKKVWDAQGVVCAMVTAATDLVDPADAATVRLFEACGQAEVGLVKLGYWVFERGQDYWKQVDAVRAALEGFAKLAERTGVRAMMHTHSGPYYGSNCGGLMHLVRGFDPRWVGAYLDMGHMAVEGERFEQGVAMVGAHLSAVAAKDLRKVADYTADPPTWSNECVKMGQGFVNWVEALGALKAAGFDGPITVHAEYAKVDATMREQWLAEDVQLFKRVLTDAGGGFS